MHKSIDILNRRLISTLDDFKLPYNLAYGKMGVCIYFFILSRHTQNRAIEELAFRLLHEIIEKIDEVTPVDVKCGISGIGLGIDYLVEEKYAEGDINIILKDIDDIVYKNLSYEKYLEKIDLQSLTHLLYYLSRRLKKQKNNTETKYLFEELIIQTINNLHEKMNIEFFEEPLIFSMDYLLPQLLIVYSLIFKNNFYNYKLIKILQELSYNILTKIPLLHSHRLLLLWGMDALNKQIKDEKWTEHISFLKEKINLDYIISTEIKSKNIFFIDGLTGIYYLLEKTSHCFLQEEVNKSKKNILNIIYSSETWDNLIDNTQLFYAKRDIYSGFTGTSILQMLVIN